VEQREATGLRSDAKMQGACDRRSRRRSPYHIKLGQRPAVTRIPIAHPPRYI
jgi:hypothetical protein